MEESKTSFVLYSDSFGLINQLPDEIAGKLFKHIYLYVNDENPKSDDLLLNIAFEPIKMQLKRDLVKWEKTKEGRSVAGKASAEARKIFKEFQQNSTNPTNVDFVTSNPTNVDFVENNSTKFNKGQQTSTNPTVNDNVNVNVNVNVNDNEINNNKNIAIAVILKNPESQGWREVVAMKNKQSDKWVLKKLDEFVLHLKSKMTCYTRKKEFVDHFTNWLPKNESIKNRSNGNSNRGII